MRKYFFNSICVLLTLVIFSPHANAIPTTNWEAILKPAEYLQSYSWGKQQGKGGGGDDDDNYNYNDDNSYNNDDDNYSSGDDDDHYNNDDDNYSSGDDDDHYSNDDDDSSEIPLDGGLGFLAAAGAGLGIKKLRDNRAKKKAERDMEQ